MLYVRACVCVCVLMLYLGVLCFIRCVMFNVWTSCLSKLIHQKMNFEASTSMWMPSPPRRPAVTLTFDLWSPESSRLSVGVMNISCKFHRNCSSLSWDIIVTILFGRTNGRTHAEDGHAENIMSSPTLTGNEIIINILLLLLLLLLLIHTATAYSFRSK